MVKNPRKYDYADFIYRRFYIITILFFHNLFLLIIVSKIIQIYLIFMYYNKWKKDMVKILKIFDNFLATNRTWNFTNGKVFDLMS